MSSKPIIREAKAEDRDKIIAFFNEFETPYKRDRAYWIWLNRIVTTDYSIIAVAEYNKSIIAHYAIVPLDINVKGQRFRGAQGLNAVVSESHRDKVRIYEVTRLAYTLARERGIDFMYCFPNKNYWRIQVKIEGCHLLSQIVAIRVSTDRDVDVSSEFRLLEYKDSISNHFELDSLVEYYNSKNYISVHKNLSYFLSRYIRHPQKLYKCFFVKIREKISAFIVLKKYVNPFTKEVTGHLIDYIKSPNIGEYTLIALTNSYFNNLGVKDVVFWPINSEFRNSLKSFSVKSEFESFPCLKFFGQNISENIKEELLNYENWEFQMGDCDVF